MASFTVAERALVAARVLDRCDALDGATSTLSGASDDLDQLLVNLAETAGQPAVTERLQLMGLRLYRFGHSMFGLAFLLGLVLWLGYRVIPDFPTMVAPGGAGWLHAKLGLVVVLLAYFIWIGRLLKGVAKGRALPSSRALRWINEIPLLAFIPIVWLVLAKPF